MVSIETYTQTGHFVSPKDATPGRGFIYITPDQTVTDGVSDVVVAGVKVKVDLVAGAFTVSLPTGIGYHGRPVLMDGYPPEADWTVPTGTVTLDWADITNVALSPLNPTGLELAMAYTDAAVAAIGSPDGGVW